MCDRRGQALARHEESKHQGTRTVTRTESSGTTDLAREELEIFKNQSPAGLFWYCFCVLCLFFFFPSETGLDSLSPFSFWQMDNSHHTPLT